MGGYNPNIQEDVYNSVALKICTTKKFSLQDLKGVYVEDKNYESEFSTKTFKKNYTK